MEVTESKKRRRACAPAVGTFVGLNSNDVRPQWQAGQDRMSRASSFNSSQASRDGDATGLSLSRSSSRTALTRSDSSGLVALVSAASGAASEPDSFDGLQLASIPGSLPATPRQSYQMAPELLPGALTDTRYSRTDGLTPAQAGNQPELRITLTQGTDRSQGWMRANGRSTVAHLEVRGLDDDLSRMLREVLLTGARPNNPMWAEIKLELLYSDTEDAVHLKMHGRFMDKLDLMLPNGSAKNSHEINVNWFCIHTVDGVSMQHRNHELRPWKPQEFLEVRKPRVEDPSIVECSIKFSTNITSRAHSKRLFFWRASVVLGGFPGCGNPLMLCARTPEFEYRPRPPQEERPALREVFTDGKPGDMIVCVGDRVGDLHADVRLVLRSVSNPERALVLPRSRMSKTTYVAHLPPESEGIPLGRCIAQLINDDSQTDTIEINYGATVEIAPLLALSKAVNDKNIESMDGGVAEVKFESSVVALLPNVTGVSANGNLFDTAAESIVPTVQPSHAGMHKGPPAFSVASIPATQPEALARALSQSLE